MERHGPREIGLAVALGRLGIWDAGLCFQPAADARRIAAALDDAGVTAAWLHSGGHDPFAFAPVLLQASSRLVVGTSIVSIWRHGPDQMANAARTIGEAFPGRFVLGIGTSHQGARSWAGRGYEKPLQDLSDYLDAMDQAPWNGPRPEPPVPRMIAALGPKMLDLTRRRSRGAIPYLVPVEYTAFARERLGPEPVLAIHQAAVIGESEAKSRELAREHVAAYLQTTNYPNNLRRLGWSEADLEAGGSDRLIDALVVRGDAEVVAGRVRAHLAAGADHVCVNPLSPRFPEVPLPDLADLSARLTVDSGVTREK
ncbi:MAG: TIGR03620 family F420-dependent LLM class oxidoreductase [Dehalococcoidia bacterium]